MSLEKEFFNRDTNIKATVIADSISPDGVRLTTLELEYPRFIHSELLTHRAFSKNSSSSRAIPIHKMLEYTESNMATPIYWGKNKSGMQANDEVASSEQIKANYQWNLAFREMKYVVNRMSDLTLHKQVPNRLLEPFQMMKVVVTATDWDNFFNLRIHPDAQPEICMLAYKIYKAVEESKPVELREGDWHLPFVNIGWNGKGEMCYADDGFEFFDLEDAIKYSAACCASVSYRTENMTIEKADKIFDMLIKAEVVHSSPFEHLATPIRERTCIVTHNGFGLCDDLELSENLLNPETWQDGVTHQDKYGNLYSGNLRGWVQYRHLLKNNTAWKFDFEERMKMFG